MDYPPPLYFILSIYAENGAFFQAFLSHGIARVNSASAHLAFKKGSISLVLFSPWQSSNKFDFAHLA